MKNKSLLLATMLGVTILTGCTIKPMLIHQTTDFPVSSTISQKAIESSIIAAAHRKDWQVLDAVPGVVTLSYPQKSNPRYQTINAVVRVEYTDKNYRIVHVSERGLEKEPCATDPNKICIHRNYNRWIANLDLQIQNQLQRIAR